MSLTIETPHAAASATEAQTMAAGSANLAVEAAKLTRDLNTPKPSIYWADFLVSVIIGYAGLAAAVLGDSLLLQMASAIIAVLALY